VTSPPTYEPAPPDRHRRRAITEVRVRRLARLPHSRTRALADASRSSASEAGELSAGIACERAVTQSLALTSRLLGMIVNRTETRSVLISADYLKLRQTIINALKPYPEAARASAGHSRGSRSRSPRPSRRAPSRCSSRRCRHDRGPPTPTGTIVFYFFLPKGMTCQHGSRWSHQSLSAPRFTFESKCARSAAANEQLSLEAPDGTVYLTLRCATGRASKSRSAIRDNLLKRAYTALSSASLPEKLASDASSGNSC
jgi:hypothetical protein